MDVIKQNTDISLDNLDVSFKRIHIEMLSFIQKKIRGDERSRLVKNRLAYGVKSRYVLDANVMFVIKDSKIWQNPKLYKPR